MVPYMDVDLDDEDSLATGSGQRYGHGPEWKKGLCQDCRGCGFPGSPILRTSMPWTSSRRGPLLCRPAGGAFSRRPGDPSRHENTMGDLKWLRETGMEAAILRKYGEGCFVFGVCGGFQMLGMRLSDPFGIEEGGTLRGARAPSSGNGVFQGEDQDPGARGTPGCLRSGESQSLWLHGI